MRRMSFALTTQQVKDKTKTVTRRMGWSNLKPGDLVQPVVKCMGLKKGEKQELIGGPIRILDNQPIELDDITYEDLQKEGFPEMNRWDFIKLFQGANKCEIDAIVNRIEFEYV